MERVASVPSLVDARRRFFAEGGLPRGVLPEAILRSWTRCSSLGLRADQLPAADVVHRGDFVEACSRHERLRRICRPELEALLGDAQSTGSIAVLCAPDGLILDAIGNMDFADRAARVALRAGVPWAETVSGTNAIGTALIERQPVEVRGAEHFFAPHAILSCAAAPILGGTGEVLGALDLTGSADFAQTHALGLVRLAVDAVEHRLFESAQEGGRRVLRLHRDAALLGTAREGILVFEDARWVGANRHALELLGLDWASVGKLRFSDLFDGRPRTVEGQWTLRTHQGGRRLYLRDGGASSAAVPIPALPAALASPGAVEQLRRSEPALTPFVPGQPAPSFSAELERQITRGVRVAAAEIPLLVCGETGTGKEVVARELHRRGQHALGPFVAVNCAALPETLIEAELFGYEEGAFTGARRGGMKGRVQEAHGGTLFLDEIGDMPLSLQPRLLRVLQEREVAPLGGGAVRAVNFHLICATHRSLGDAVAEGRFRADLYYRIAQYAIELEPLRQLPARRVLLERLWQQIAPGRVLESAAVQQLADYDWPGNLRQLVATLRTLAALSEPGVPVVVEDLPNSIRQPRLSPALRAGEGAGSMNEIADAVMKQALDQAGGNVTRAARQLGISRSTLYRRLGIKPH
jgi:transcriptional regulator of acetoin/glycerol metabolism